ncbi:hypothetical protein E4U17_005541 [Claviceps sp. LM77 group G4]|nr:hypothetical protein E4U17_005541 [Claviceps sp. LM77 group G4]KAG6059897.1 hypothetical protein E4U33_007038 [Claviceps sp. LM78 group G4]KAG6072664.1 hypothetical protein E4U16_005194 [Claviceps sp. LM84 group G4]
MKSAKSVAVDAPSHRRSQPSRQARTNPSRRPANATRAGESSNAANGSRSLGAQPVEILPAITHFADGMSALPKELVRHFTLLKEVDAKIFAPEEQLFKLVAETAKLPVPNTTQSVASNQAHPLSAGDDAAASAAPTIDVFDPSNIPRRQLFRQTAVKIQEMLVSLEEKNHVLCTANEALQRQLARVEDVWPYLENEFSDEAKWGSNTHWAYPENRSSGKVSQTERMRRDGAAAISAAAQALAEEAAARSDARKQAVQARKNLKTQHHDSDADDLEKRPKEGPKKGGKSRKSAVAAAVDTSNVNAGVTGSTSNGSHPPKRRKVEKTANVDKVSSAAAANNNTNAVTAAPTPTPAAAAAATARASAASTTAITTGTVTAGTAVGSSGLASGSNASRPKLSSPKETPALDVPKKRKALPTGSGQAKKKTPSTTTSPVIGTNPDAKAPARASPAPGSAPAPRSGPVRARKNSVQSNTDATKGRPPTSAPVHNSNGHGSGADTPEQASTAPFPKPGSDVKLSKEAVAPFKTMESIKGEAHNPQSAPSPTNMTIAAAMAATATTTTTTMLSTFSKRDSIPEEADQEIETAPRSIPTPVPKKSGRASKPSTPALATFQEAAASRSRPSRTAEGNSGNNSSNNNTSNNNSNSHSNSNSNSSNNRKSHKKSSSAAQQSLIQQVHAADVNNSVQVEDEEGEIDADEPTYCYCNSVSYGEMVACDADGCEREWFHLACVGLKVAPGSKTKWYCEDCKDRLKMSSKKAGR